MSEIIQGTDEWKRKRAGKFTASRFVDVLARNKKTGEPLKVYHDCIWSVVTERLTGEPLEGPDGLALRWGKDVEPFAREAYELHSGNFVSQSDFVDHPNYSFVGCSPDGLIDDVGGLEMKCPKDPSVHLERFFKGVPDEYIPQIQGCMWVTGRQWWDFVSYDPRMPESHRMFLKRVERDEEFIKKLEASVLEAEAKAIELLENVRKAAA